MSVRSIQTATTLLLLTANSQHNRSTGREWQMHGEPMPHAATRGDISHVRPLDSVDHGRRDTKAHKPRLPRRISARSSLTRVLPGATASQAADRRLLTEVARGKADAFATLYDRISGPLYSLCLRMTGEAGKAEEILLEAFLVIWSRAQTYDPARSSVFAWAVHLTRGQAIGYLHSRGERSRSWQRCGGFCFVTGASRAAGRRTACRKSRRQQRTSRTRAARAGHDARQRETRPCTGVFQRFEPPRHRRPVGTISKHHQSSSQAWTALVA